MVLILPTARSLHPFPILMDLLKFWLLRRPTREAQKTNFSQTHIKQIHPTQLSALLARCLAFQSVFVLLLRARHSTWQQIVIHSAVSLTPKSLQRCLSITWIRMLSRDRPSKKIRGGSWLKSRKNKSSGLNRWKCLRRSERRNWLSSVLWN